MNPKAHELKREIGFLEKKLIPNMDTPKNVDMLTVPQLLKINQENISLFNTIINLYKQLLKEIESEI